MSTSRRAILGAAAALAGGTAANIAAAAMPASSTDADLLGYPPSPLAILPTAVPPASLLAADNSIVQTLCAEYRRKHREGFEWSKKASAAARRAEASLPPLDSRISLDELRTHPDFDRTDQQSRAIAWGGGFIPTHVIKIAIDHCHFQLTKTATELHAVTLAEPISEEDKAKVARLRERLALSEERRKQLDKANKVNGVKEFEHRASRCWSGDCYKLERQIIRARSQDYADLEAKLRLYKTDISQFADTDSKGMNSLLGSIVRDAMALLRQEVLAKGCRRDRGD